MFKFQPLLLIVASQGVVYPPGCTTATFPDHKVCAARGWDLGDGATDPCAPLGPYPVSGQQVYIQDPFNFCINLADPDSPVMKENYYSKQKYPSIVAAEGYVRSFCVGDYVSPGGLRMNPAAVTSAHVLTGLSKNGKSYIQISGTLDCNLVGVNCDGPDDDNGGQYDAVEFRKCGKEPYSGVDKSKHPTFVDYTEQAGNHIFCMRVCEAGQQREDPCNVKDDEKGCEYTMGVTFPEGFTLNGAPVTRPTISSNGTFYVPPPLPKPTQVGSNPSSPTTAPGQLL